MSRTSCGSSVSPREPLRRRAPLATDSSDALARSGHLHVSPKDGLPSRGGSGGREQDSTPVNERKPVMPLIEVKLIKNVFSSEQKREIIERLTDAMVEVEGENMRSVTWVTVQEVASGDWGIGGNALTTEDVKALQSGVAA